MLGPCTSGKYEKGRVCWIPAQAGITSQLYLLTPMPIDTAQAPVRALAQRAFGEPGRFVESELFWPLLKRPDNPSSNKFRIVVDRAFRKLTNRLLESNGKLLSGVPHTFRVRK